VQDPAPPGRRKVQPGGAGLQYSIDVERRVPAEEGRRRERGVGGGATPVEGGGGGRGRVTLFLPTPDFMASAGEV